MVLRVIHTAYSNLGARVVSVVVHKVHLLEIDDIKITIIKKIARIKAASVPIFNNRPEGRPPLFLRSG